MPGGCLRTVVWVVTVAATALPPPGLSSPSSVFAGWWWACGGAGLPVSLAISTGHAPSVPTHLGQVAAGPETLREIMRLPRTFFLFCLQGIVPTRPSWLSRTETDSGCPRGHAVPSGTWTGVTGVVPRAGLSREPLSLKHTLLGLKYGAKVDKVLKVRPSQNGGSRPPTLRTT